MLPYTDVMNSVVGMRYFLQEPWHFPLLDAQGLLYPHGASIAFTDSIPLAALLTKALFPLWPMDANYLGFWMLLNYIGQGASASYLAGAFRRFPIYVHMCVALLALFVPAFLIRLAHTALCSHFFIILALGLAVRLLHHPHRQRLAYWFTPLIAAAFLTHVYLAAMAASIYGACQVQLFLMERRNRRLIGRQLLLTAVVMTVVYYAFGYNGGYGGAIYGFYSMNLYSPFVPQVSSLFGRHDIIDPTGGQYEGYNYVGAGLLLLFGAALTFARQNLIALFRRYWSLVLLCVAFTLFALSTRVYAGSHLVFDACRLPLLCTRHSDPNHIRFALFNQFRCSGRFFWPVTYFALGLSVAALWPVLDRRHCTWILCFVVLIQLADLDYLRDHQQHTLKHRESLNALITAALPLIEAHQRVTILPSFACVGSGDELWQVLDLVFLASHKAIPVNTAFLARVREKDVVDCGREIPDLAARGPEPNELLIFLKSKLDYYHILTIYNHPENCKQDATYVFCSPKLPTLKSLTQGLKSFQATPPVALDVDTKPTLSFADKGNGVQYLREGWSTPETWGVWSEKPTASLELPLAQRPQSELTLSLTIGAFLSAKHPTEQVDILLNGSSIAHVTFTQSTASQRQTLKLPLNLVGEKQSIELLFRPSAPISPKDLGLSEDRRVLGVSLTELQLTQ
jgi:hypothetical protein